MVTGNLQKQVLENVACAPETSNGEAAIIHCHEKSQWVSKGDAIRERVRLHPQAMISEIVAMFELDGVKVSPSTVERIVREMKHEPSDN